MDMKHQRYRDRGKRTRCDIFRRLDRGLNKNGHRKGCCDTAALFLHIIN